MNQIELLAPAKDAESGRIAINAGADAIYIGAAKFGARQAVGNSLRDIEALVGYAHRYWARVYAVVNTLLHDHEIDLAANLIQQLYNVGVDAVIIQDLGLLEVDLPPIPLYASTQMHNHTPEKVAFLEGVGIQRVILARELSLREIAAIRAATNVELETFIHGALCVCYSGQCALSYAIGGRSGNRGQCAQPCRKCYSLLDKNGNVLIRDSHLLSLKDFNLTEYLRDLMEVGVCSFKIEGRLKDQAYVKNVVAHYRQHLDAILPDFDLKPSSSGRVTLDFEPDPAKTFNRGFTTYFLTGERASITSFETPKHAGEPIGVVTTTNRWAFTLNVATSLRNGDGLTFINAEGKLQGTRVNQVQGNKIFPEKMQGITIGTQICRNADRQFLKQVNASQPERRIPIQLKLTETKTGFELTAQDQDGNLGVATLESEKIPAKKPEQARATLKKQLTRLGDSEFDCDKFTADLSTSFFIPASALNQLRRSTIAALQAQRLGNYPRLTGGANRNNIPYPKKHLNYLGNVLNEKAAAFYHRHGVVAIEPAAESGINLAGRKVMTTKHCLKFELGACHLQNNPKSLTEPLFLETDDDLRLRLAFNCRDCVMEVYFDA